LEVKRAEVAMCNAGRMLWFPKLQSKVLNKALHMAASDQRHQKNLNHAYMFALLHAVNRLATTVFFSGVLFGIPSFMVRSLFRAHLCVID
jgi:hypothetical protein